jgi:hypothetical protein
MPEIVCNTTPLQYLHQAGVLEIIPSLYGSILIPRAVADEIAAGIEGNVDLPVLSEIGWIEIREVDGSPWPVPRDIHRGEAEVIALAGMHHDSLMILDDLAARRHARLLGLKFTGTLGVLLKAKQSGLLKNVKPVMDRLEQLGFRLGNQTRSGFLKLAEES